MGVELIPGQIYRVAQSGVNPVTLTKEAGCVDVARAALLQKVGDTCKLVDGTAITSETLIEVAATDGTITLAGPGAPAALGSATGIIAATGAPSLATDGYATLGNRFVNVWVDMAGGTSCDVQVYLYRTTVGWILYTDVPTTTVLTANGGGLFQLEPRGAERIYVRLINFVGGGATAGIFVDGVTY